ncbi:hypothetical protein HispidOSU_022046, partial [Sigmodon hispidus]
WPWTVNVGEFSQSGRGQPNVVWLIKVFLVLCGVVIHGGRGQEKWTWFAVGV